MAQQLSWTIEFKSMDELDKDWGCELGGLGAMPPVPRVGDVVSGSWLPTSDVFASLHGRAIVEKVIWTPTDPDPNAELRLDVLVLLNRQRAIDEAA